jgi:hypothetical protein
MAQRRAFVTLPQGVWDAIDNMKGTLGDGDSEVIRNLLIAELTERGIILPSRPVRASLDPVVGRYTELEQKFRRLLEQLEKKGVFGAEESRQLNSRRP